VHPHEEDWNACSFPPLKRLALNLDFPLVISVFYKGKTGLDLDTDIKAIAAWSGGDEFKKGIQPSIRMHGRNI